MPSPAPDACTALNPHRQRALPLHTDGNCARKTKNRPKAVFWS